MAGPSADDSSSWLDMFAALPTQLQGVFVTVVAFVVGYLLYRKFFTQLRGDGPKATDLVIGGPTSITDLSPVKALTEKVGALADSMATNTAKLGEVADLIGQLLTDMRDERDAEEKEQIAREAFERGLATPRPRRRQRPSKPKAG